MDDPSKAPILDHPLDEASAFTAEALIDDVRRLREIGNEALPAICFLEFDGDLTDWLVDQGIAAPFRSWACFHTTMFSLELEGVKCGIIGRTIGGPYAVLIAEQLHAAGASLIIGLTSAGRVAPIFPFRVSWSPRARFGTRALRTITCTRGRSGLPFALDDADRAGTLPTGFAVRMGKVWTTDAPYRETNQLAKWASEGVLAVEMQAASLFAFAQAERSTSLLWRE